MYLILKLVLLDFEPLYFPDGTNILWLCRAIFTPWVVSIILVDIFSSRAATGVDELGDIVGAWGLILRLSDKEDLERSSFFKLSVDNEIFNYF